MKLHPLVFLAGVAVAAVTLFAADGQPPQPTGLQVGRYQLCQGIDPELKGAGKPTMFRIDTATGAVWELTSNPYVDPGRADPLTINVWLPTFEEGHELHRAAQASWQPKK